MIRDSGRQGQRGVATPSVDVGAGLPANAVAAATMNDPGYWPAGPAYSRVNPLLRASR
ncbi:hypothetical protein METHP15_40025 [Pseudomonas sp. P15-2025]